MTNRQNHHDVYPLRTVTAQTGLSADIVRAWEKRYQVVEPVRGPRGARLYNAEDIARLRLLARVVESGRSIGDVARLDSNELARLIGRLPVQTPGDSGAVRVVLEALESFDATAVERLLGDALVGLGRLAFVERVAVPLVVEVGRRWEVGRLSVSEEHLVSATLRNLVVGMMPRRGASEAPTVLLATPKGDRHEMGLLLVALLVLDAGLAVSYLGVDLPASEIVDAARRSGATVVGISAVNGENRRQAVDAIRRIEEGLAPGAALWLGGRDARDIVGELGHFTGLVMDDLALVEGELSRLRRAAVR